MSKFQPDHKGNHPIVKITPGMTSSHSSDRTHIGEHNAVKVTLGKAPKPKHGGGVTPVHGGMTRQVQGKAVTAGGNHASALDALSGAVVPAGKGTAAVPGWGNSQVRSGNPMVHPPASKQLKRVAIHPSMSRGANHDQMLSDLGDAILKNAVRT